MFFLSRIKAYVLFVGAAIVAVVSIYFRGKADGRDDLEYEIKDKRIDDLLTAKEVKDEIDILDDDELAARASRWVREGDGR